MTAEPKPIVVYGATGFTGRLVAAELERRGATYTLAGRNTNKLAVLAAGLSSAPATRAVETADRAGMRELLGQHATVIACAGPFSLHGEPVVACAAETGTHYLDTTGEQPFIRKVIEQYGPGAEKSGGALVSGMGFDYVPGDMLAAVTAEGMGELEEITLAYAVHSFGPTQGTMLSAIEMMGGGDVEYRDGALREADRSISRGRWTFPAPVGTQRMMRYPAGEHVTVPLHVNTRKVTTLLSTSATLPPRLGAAAPALLGAAQRLAATPARRGLNALIRRLPEGPKEQDRQAARFTIQCHARAADGRERVGTLSGSDIYATTARIIVHGAILTADPGFKHSGGLAPAAAFEPGPFLDAIADIGIEYSLGPIRGGAG